MKVTEFEYPVVFSVGGAPFNMVFDMRWDADPADGWFYGLFSTEDVEV